MRIVARFIPLLIVALFVFTEPGQDLWDRGGRLGDRAP